MGEKRTITRPLPIVRPVVGERGRYWVRSRTDPGLEYLIDIEAYDGNGWCACQKFEFKMWPALEDGAERSERLQCQHIVAAKLYDWQLWFDTHKRIWKKAGIL